MKRVAIVGTRPPFRRTEQSADWPEMREYRAIVADVERFIAEAFDADGGFFLITGGADGVDSVAENCVGHWKAYKPDYATHGQRAPLIRNQKIVDDAEEIHAWPSSWSRGTWDTVRRAKAAGKPCVVHEPFKERR